jgi:flagellar operon protein
MGIDNRLTINQPLNPVKKGDNNKAVQKNKQAGKSSEKISFQKVLSDKIKDKTGVEFSKHARQRMITRDIKVSETQLNKLKNAVEKAENKGAKDSLIMVDKVAYVVSVENKTVITAMDNKNVKENVFTNIDSAVFM